MSDMSLCFLGGLDNTREQMEQCLKRIEKARDAIKADVAQIDTMWEGPAHDEFKQEWNNEIAELEELIGTFKRITEYEKSAYDIYSKAVSRALATAEGKKVNMSI
ncbi:WXG100 family type VII secretion target [Butyrivibrio sp. JL13D10]|uniref:WXG100 family type VII secretion target n=1 Tax=Butyrivibrio sp. JL13D10 TaxID=3236815 RepID=UPI0038B4648E